MLFLLLLVTVIRCIPKHKLPYCLGGTCERECFVCFTKYKQWCARNGINQPPLTQEALSNMTPMEAVKATCDKLNRPIDSLLPFR